MKKYNYKQRYFYDKKEKKLPLLTMYTQTQKKSNMDIK